MADTLQSLVESNTLGFCCIAAFFAANEKVSTGLLAERLGLDKRTVRRHRADWRNGNGCAGHPRCLIAGAPDEKMQRRLTRKIGSPAVVAYSAPRTTKGYKSSSGKE